MEDDRLPSELKLEEKNKPMNKQEGPDVESEL